MEEEQQIASKSNDNTQPESVNTAQEGTAPRVARKPLIRGKAKEEDEEAAQRKKEEDEQRKARKKQMEEEKKKAFQEFLKNKKEESANVDVTTISGYAGGPRAEGIPVYQESDFEILRECGKGQFGVVMAAIQKSTGRRVAIKVLRNTGLKYELLVRREYEIMVTSKHPNVVEACGLFADDLNLYLVMEFLSGGELFQQIEKRYASTKSGYDEATCRIIFRQLVEAIELMHSKRIAHWDLKPQNIICDSTDSLSFAKITDFGLSHRLDVDGEVKKFRGTPHYCSPEMLENQHYGVEADMWSLGCILFLMISGRPAFSELNFITLCELISNSKYDLESSEWKTVSAEAKDLIRKLLCVDYKERLTATQALQHPWFGKKQSVTRASLTQVGGLQAPHHALLRTVFFRLSASPVPTQTSSALSPTQTLITNKNLELAFAEFGLHVTPAQMKVLLHRQNHRFYPSAGLTREEMKIYKSESGVSELLQELTLKVLEDQPENIADFVLTKLFDEAAREWAKTTSDRNVNIKHFIEMFQTLVMHSSDPVLVLDTMTLFYGLDDNHDLCLTRTQFESLCSGVKKTISNDPSLSSYPLKVCFDLILNSPK
eukprot:c7567_g1_i1.p1 GENE.c7567_g1_i1~~c7567_g1_i1.p1  ORF type:complete len:601 (+),score=158.65 c7567_g1_i1:47-1849(+)